MTDSESRNRLDEALSPYLLQHADNPVHWQPWDSRALDRARELERPILLSIGYSACHWCHVMAHESFENERIAGVMNAHFVNIKVDREERPDLDRIYQLAHQLLTGRGGGWPLTVFLDPRDQAPFFAGTYFPAKAGAGMVGFGDLLERIGEVWRTRRDELRAQTRQVQQALQAVSRPQPGDEHDLNESGDTLLGQLTQRFDADHGGFGGAPKFPQAPLLAFLEQRAADDTQAAQMLADTLAGMARHGLHDHLAGGFFRYSVDAAWEIPHFEKMLYDNALLLDCYARAAWRWQRADFTATCERTVDWLMSEMRLENGGFAASLDADTDDGEGASYLWRPDEVRALLDEPSAGLVVRRFGLDGPPNFESRRWHLVIASSLGELTTAERDRDATEALLESARHRLLEARRQRPAPARDDKLIAGWNGLAITALARAGRLLGREDWQQAAAGALDAVAVNLFGQEPPRAVWRDGRSDHPATLEDHANVLLACLAVLSWRFETRWFNLARRLARRIREQFVDAETGALYLTPAEHERLIARPLAHSDDATPSGAGQTIEALARCGHLTGDAGMIDCARQALSAASGEIRRAPMAYAGLLAARRMLEHPPPQILFGGDADTIADWRGRLEPDPDRAEYVIAPLGCDESLPELLQPLATAETPVAIVCAGTRCLAPAHDADTLQARLDELA